MILSFFLILLVAFLILFIVPINSKSVVSVIISLLLGIVSSFFALYVMLNSPINYLLDDTNVIKTEIGIDYLSAFFIIIINIVVIISSIYNIGYNKNQSNIGKLNLHYACISILHFSMLGVLVCQSFIPFLIFWEIVAVSSFLLILYESKSKEIIKIAINYLVQMHVCMLFLLIGAFILISTTGIYTFESCKTYFETHNNFFLFLLFFIGFGMKAGFVPLHTWLPKADPAAPNSVAAIMSGATIKLGIYGILRILIHIKTQQYEIGMFLVIISLITGLFGIINAIVQTDIKKSLAFSSIENIGIIGLGLGLGFIGIAVENYSLAFLGLAGSILHIFNHAMFKSLLFLGAGNIYIQTGTTNMSLLGGILNKAKVSGTIFLIASLAICGLPPFNGFVSEFLIYDGIIGEFNKGNVSIDVLLLVSLFGISIIGGMSIINFTRMFGMTFLGKRRMNLSNSEIKEVSPWMYIPQIFLVLIILSIVIFSTYYIEYVHLVIHQFLPKYHVIPSEAMAPQPQILIVIGILILSIMIVSFIKHYFSKSKIIEFGPTWGCGYTGETSKMQYTPSSFSESFENITGQLLNTNIKFKPIDKLEIFPASRAYTKANNDILDENFLDPPIHYIQRNLKLFSIFKSGNTQTYVWYAFLFLLILFILTFSEII